MSETNEVDGEGSSVLQAISQLKILSILNLRPVRAYVNLVIERSFFYGQETMEINRGTMGKNRTTAAKTPKIKTRRKALDRQSKGIRRNPLDTAYRRTMGGFAKAISKSINMLAKAQRLGRKRCLAQRMASFSFRT